MSAAVVSTSVIGSAATMIHRGVARDRASPRICSRNVRALAKNRRCVEPEDHTPGQPFGVRVAAHVVVAGHARDPAEDGLVGPPGAAEHVADRQRDRHRDAGQHAEHDDADEGGDRQRELGPAQRGRAARVPGMSASEIDAAITTAARVGCGRFRSRPGASSRIRVIAAAPTSPVTWVLAPACSATAVREPLVLTGKPWNSPPPMLAAPIPIISRSPSTAWPVRAANDEAVEIVSASDTTAMPSAPASSSARSESLTSGMVNGGNPCGRAPTSVDAVVGETEQRRRADRQHDHDQHGRDPRQHPLQHQDQDQADQPDRQRGRHRLAARHAR